MSENGDPMKEDPKEIATMRTGRRPSWLRAAVMLTVLSASMWVFTFDGSSVPGKAVLGGYRDRWFLVNLLLTYLTALAGVIALIRVDRSTVFRLVAMNAGVVFVLVAFELVAVAGIVDYRDIFMGAATLRGGIDERLRHMSRPNVRIEGNVAPDLVSWLGADAEPVPYVFETDRYGLRNPVDKEDPRVACLGDSVLVAGLVPVESIVTERLQRSLGVSVLNVSEVGYSPQEEVIRFQNTGIDANRLIVHFIFEGNDLGDSYEWRQWRDRALATEWPASGLVKSALRLLDEPRRAAGRRRIGRCSTGASPPQTVHFLYDTLRSDRESEWVHLREALLEARDQVLSNGGRYAIVVVPSKLTVLHSFCSWPAGSELDDPARWQGGSLRPNIAQLSADEGIPHLDLTAALRQVTAGGELPYFASDTHLNERGHQAMAESLAPWIAELVE